ncbi:phosphoribosylamine--glycine ligase [Pelagicoccus sp. SDUM812003]|uniref:phosphoribosylamine--glycine ligase n=1 Tax=Pelagicoccus sp. SDUM812003 TaxID=3041267 RepID=UPI00280EBFAF|nr:phosphoribosylamine--glycine ligase [Pelagicoccus sp. SDUM812003]MDQ8203155.1 phosphoribosylamine--glycine ligase [Pelagicoccus sp. SDUM812003]
MSENTPLNVLIVGSGGREHALANACVKSPLAARVIAAPGNPGISADCDCFKVAADDIDGLVALAVEQKIDFVIVGPEVPLALGLVDALQEKGILAYGPKADGGRLEASKIFTKKLLLKHKIPTGAAAAFDKVDAAIDYLETASYPIVVKADGLAAGKGVIIAKDHDEAVSTVRDMIEGAAFGESGKEVLIEECLYGEETSIHVIVSGNDYVILPTSQDHKQIFEGDKGPNTGGMGAYSPADLIDDDLMARIEEEIVKPSVAGIAAEGIDFRGTLFIGIMITEEGPKVLEYNTRFGDPETQVLLTRLKTDPMEIMLAAAKGELGRLDVTVKDQYAMVVVLASDGYPGTYPKGETITFPKAVGENEVIFHAGTRFNEAGDVVTNGGRVLGVTALGADLKTAADKAYALCDQIRFKSKYLRRDIGAKELNRQR